MFRYQIFVNGTPQTQYASNIATAINDAVKQALRWTHMKNQPLSISADRADSLKYGRFVVQAVRPADGTDRSYYSNISINGEDFVRVGDRRIEILCDTTNQLSIAAKRVLALEPEATRVVVMNQASGRQRGSWKRED